MIWICMWFCYQYDRVVALCWHCTSDPKRGGWFEPTPKHMLTRQRVNAACHLSRPPGTEITRSKYLPVVLCISSTGHNILTGMLSVTHKKYPDKHDILKDSGVQGPEALLLSFCICGQVRWGQRVFLSQVLPAVAVQHLQLELQWIQ